MPEDPVIIPDGVSSGALPADYDTLRKALGDAQAEEVAREFQRADAMSQIARYRWYIAQKHHKLANNKSLQFEHYPYQKEIYECDAESMVVMGSVQWGKALANDCPVLTESGWKPMGEIRVGDRVQTPDGTGGTVRRVYPQGEIPVNTVTFEDGRSLEACDQHRWEVLVRVKGKRREWINHSRPVINTAQIRDLLAQGRRVFIPLPKPVSFPERNLPLDPYLLGMLLGDGELGPQNFRFATGDEQLRADCDAELAIHGLELHKYASDSKYTYRIRTFGGWARGAGEHPLSPILNHLGLLGTDCFSKFIPKQFLEASFEQRWALLQGLMDTDGGASPSAEYSTSSQQLADDVAYLVRSLGGIASIKPRATSYTKNGERFAGATSYRIHIRLTDNRQAFRLHRKQATTTVARRIDGELMLELTGITPSGVKPATCISIDHPRHLFIAKDFITSHNTEFLLCTAAAMAGYGLKVFFVFSKIEKRNKVVADRIDPAFKSIKLYKALVEAAKKERGAESDSTGLKHFGKGSINFVGANSDKDFTSFQADVAIVDEHQECDQDNIGGIFERMSGSPYRFELLVGNPRLVGTAENQNLDWQYQQSDQRQWHIPCDYCGELQVLDWWQHFVRENKSKTGAILSIESRDSEWDPNGILDMRPICLRCARPMNRLHREGKWIPRNPGHRRKGYNLSNLYNVNVRMGGARSLMERYVAAQYSPIQIARFWNDQLGLAFTQEGTSITDRMLSQSSTGELCGMSPYLLAPSSQLRWEELAA